MPDPIDSEEIVYREPEPVVDPAAPAPLPAFEPGELVNVVGQDGKVVAYKSEDLPWAMNNGYRLESNQEAKIAQGVKEQDNWRGTVNVGIGQAVNTALFGIPEAIDNATSTPEEIEMRDAIIADHPYANYGGMATGLVVGEGSGLFKPVAGAGAKTLKAAERLFTSDAEKLVAKGLMEGGMAERAAEAAARPFYKTVATKAIGSTAENLAFEAPRILTEGMLGDTDAAAEHFKAAGGVGLGFGLASGFISGSYGKLSRALDEATKLAERAEPGAKAAGKEFSSNEVVKKAQEWLGDWSARTQEKSHGAQKSLTSREGFARSREATNRLSEKGYYNVGMQSPEQLIEATQRASQDGVNQINQNLAILDSKFDQIKDIPAIEGRKSILQALDDLESKLENKSVHADKINLLNKMKSDVENGLEIVRNNPNEWATKIEQLKRDVAERADYNQANSKSLNAFAKKAVRTVKDSIDQIFVDTANHLKMPEVVEGLNAGRQLYGDAAIFRKYNKNLQNMQGNNQIGLSQNIANSIGLGTLMSGHFGGLVIPVTKAVMDTTQFRTAAASLAYKLSKYGGENAGLLTVQKAIQHGDQQISRIPTILSGSFNKAMPSSNLPMYAVTRFLGESKRDSSKTNRLAQVEKIGTKVREMNANPTMMATNLVKTADPLTLGAPNVSASYVKQMQKVYQHIETILPKSKKDLNPFKKTVSQPSDTELAEFERRMAVIENPYFVLDSLESGTITKGQIDTLREIYPTIYGQMVEKIVDAAYNQEKPIPYEARLKLSLLLGEPIDDSIKNTQAYQATFAPIQDEGSSSGTKVNVIPKPSENPFATNTQKM